MSGWETLALAGVAALTLLAAILAVAETSLTRLSRTRCRVLIDESEEGGMLAWLLRHRREALAWVLLFALVSQLGVAALIAWWALPRWGVAGLGIAFALQVGVLYLLAEALPKSLAGADPERALRRVAPLLRPLRLLSPVRRLLSTIGVLRQKGDDGEQVSEEELLAVAEQAAEDASIEVSEQQIIESVISFGDTLVREVMVPRTDMVTVEMSCTVAEALDVALFNGLTRLPVCGKGVDDIEGVTHVRDLIAALRRNGEDDPVSEAMREARFVPDTKRSAELLREMQNEHFHMVVVIDEYGGTAGLATLEDLLEEVFGEITDEFDVERVLVDDLGAGRFRVSGRLPLDDLSDLLGTDLPTGRWRTVGGLIFTRLGRVPLEGESLDVNGHRLQVERVLRRRIARVLVAPGGEG